MVIRVSKHFFCYLGLFGLVAMIVIAATMYRLQKGSVSVNFLTSTLESRIEKKLGEQFSVIIDDTIISWRDIKKPPQLHAVSLKLISKGKNSENKDFDYKNAIVSDVVLNIPEIAVSFSIKGLSHLKIRPSSITVYNPKINLVRKKDGSFEYDFGSYASSSGNNNISEDNKLCAQITSQLNSLGKVGYFKYLHSLKIVNIGFGLKDEKLHFVWDAPDVNIDVEKDNEKINLVGKIPLRAKGDSKSYPDKKYMRLTANYDTKNKIARIGMFLREILPSDISSYFPKDSDITKNINLINAIVDGDIIIIANLKPDSLNLDTLRRILWDVKARDGFIEAPFEFGAIYPVKNARVKGSLNTGLGDVNIESFNIKFANDAEIKGNGITDGLMAFLDKENNAGHASVFSSVINAELYKLPVSDLGDYWPSTLVPPARDWMATNMSEGFYDEGKFSFYIKEDLTKEKAVTLDKLEGELKISGATIDYITGMPIVTGVGGSAKFTKDNIVVSVDKGKSSKINVVGATLEFKDFQKEEQVADFSLHGEGLLPDALEYIDNDPLNYGDEVTYKPSQTKGNADINVSLKFPLTSWFDPAKHIDTEVNATLTDVVISDVAFGRDLNKGKLKLHADSKGVSLKGNAEITGFDPYVSGGVETNIDYFKDTNDKASLNLEFNPTNNDMSLPLFSWEKSKGNEILVKTKVKMNKGKITDIYDIDIKSGDEIVLGAIKNNNDSIKIDFSKLKFAHNDTELSAFISEKESSLTIKGKSFDFSNIPSSLVQENDSDKNNPAEEISKRIKDILEGNGNATVNVGVEKGFASKEGYIGDFKLNLQKDNKGWKSGNLSGTVGKNNTPITMQFLPHKNPKNIRSLTFELLSKDAGGVLEALGITKNFRRGELEIKGETSSYFEDVEGMAHIYEYRVVGAPILAKLFTIASFTGIVDMLGGEGIAFDKLRMPFKKSGSRIYFEDAKTSGVTIGLTGKGFLDMKEGEIDMRGIAIPAYMFNSLLGKIPIIGTVFSGEDGGGLFAITYKIRGNASDPDVKVNALSAFAPGVLRNLFGSGTDKPGDDSLDIESAPKE